MLIPTTFDKISLRLNLIKFRLEKGHLNRRQYIPTMRYTFACISCTWHKGKAIEQQFFAQCDIVNELLTP
jgi:hypothetical protein